MSVTKDHILSEIRRIAREQGGAAPGEQAFSKATGIKKHEWRGRLWIRWAQALEEAGFSANSWQKPFPEDELFSRLSELVRDLGHFPVDAELTYKRHNDPEFPGRRLFYERFGGLRQTAEALLRHARAKGDADIVAICEARMDAQQTKRRGTADVDVTVGVVYLMKSGEFYKIGLSNSSGRREYELGIQLPEKLKLVHEIETDCPAALEKFWHDRFASKRRNGEWFDLNAADIKSFKARKQFMFGEAFP